MNEITHTKLYDDAKGNVHLHAFNAAGEMVAAYCDPEFAHSSHYDPIECLNDKPERCEWPDVSHKLWTDPEVIIRERCIDPRTLTLIASAKIADDTGIEFRIEPDYTGGYLSGL